MSFRFLQYIVFLAILQLVNLPHLAFKISEKYLNTVHFMFYNLKTLKNYLVINSGLPTDSTIYNKTVHFDSICVKTGHVNLNLTLDNCFFFIIEPKTT